MIVMKFGGTSLADEAALRRVVDVVGHERQGAGTDRTGPVVVVSAFAGVTDRLLALAALAGRGDGAAAAGLIDELRATAHRLAGALVRNGDARLALLAGMDDELAEVASLAHALDLLREVSARSLDAIAARGELISSRLVTAVLADAGLPAVWVDARQIIATDAEHTRAAPLMEVTAARVDAQLRPPLARGAIPVLGGFIGSTSEGITTTLGRGGSDYSAALIGHCLRADEIQIWTDVDGMLTADPRIIQTVRIVPQLSFAEASELAYFGAKVLHPSTILPAVSADIPVRILNSHRPAGPGTLITAAPPGGPRPLTAIACKSDITVIDVTSTRMLMAYGFLRRVFEIFEQHRTSVDVVTTSEVSVSITIDDRREVQPIVLALSEFSDVTCAHDMALVCAVSDGLQLDPSLFAQVIGALDGIPLQVVSQAASRRNITVVLRQAHLRTALERLHQRFFEDGPDRPNA